MTLTEEQIAEIRARVEAATPGPWKWWTSNSWNRLKSDDQVVTRSVAEPFVNQYDRHPDLSINEADMDFIAHARTDIPALLSALEAEKKRADEAEQKLQHSDIGVKNLIARAESAEAELAKVTDPNAVHVNMLRGTIAKPSVAQIKHLYGDTIADPAELTRLREENERYREAARGQLVVVNTASSRIKELEEVVVKLREALKRFAEVAEWDIGDNESDNDTYRPMDPRYSVSGNISIGHLRRAHEVMEETDWVADKIRAQQSNDAALKGASQDDRGKARDERMRRND